MSQGFGVKLTEQQQMIKNYNWTLNTHLQPKTDINFKSKKKTDCKTNILLIFFWIKILLICIAKHKKPPKNQFGTEKLLI
jgi:hypothetical protein